VNITEGQLCANKLPRVVPTTAEMPARTSVIRTLMGKKSTESQTRPQQVFRSPRPNYRFVTVGSVKPTIARLDLHVISVPKAKKKKKAKKRSK